MCVVSATVDYFRTTVPLETWDRNTFAEYQEILRRLAELDAKLGQPDCYDPAKAAWMREVEERLARLENQ